MTDHRKLSAPADTVLEQASHWLLRLQDEACTEQERAQFQAWLAADPAHAREYSALLEIWTISGELQPTTTQPRVPIKDVS